MLKEKTAHFRLTGVAQDETLLLKFPNVIGFRSKSPENHLARSYVACYTAMQSRPFYA